MEQNQSNHSACFALARKFMAMKSLPPERYFDQRLTALAEHLLTACSSLDVAEEITAAILRCEEDCPAPATIRKYLDELNYIQEDVSREHDEHMKILRAKQKQELND